MIKNNQKINQLGHNQQTIINATINNNDKLNVVMVHSNPLNYAIRDKLALEFKERMLLYPNVNLIIAEFVHGNKHFKITDKNNINHVQLRTSNDNVLWIKENLLNIGVNRLSSNEPNYINVCFIDCDIHFDNIHWVDDTLKLLSSYDIIQMFNICLDLDSNGETMACYHSFGYQYHHHKKLFSSGQTNYSHWVCLGIYT